MTEPARVLGVDLASKRWRKNGASIISFITRDFGPTCSTDTNI